MTSIIHFNSEILLSDLLFCLTLLPSRNQYVIGIHLKSKTLIPVIFVINYSKDNNLHSLYFKTTDPKNN